MKNEALDAQGLIFWGPGSILEGIKKSMIDYAGRHRRTPWTPARGGEWWMGLKSVDIDLILSNMLVGQWTLGTNVSNK